jgi:hypothetical protein
MMSNSTLEFERLLGKAALSLWPHLPRNVQESLFEARWSGTSRFGTIWLRTCTTTIPKRRTRQSRRSWRETGYHSVTTWGFQSAQTEAIGSARFRDADRPTHSTMQISIAKNDSAS